MDCLLGIASAVIKDCTDAPIRGVEKVAYAFNRSEATITYSGTNRNEITDIAILATKKGYKIEGKNLDMNAGHSLVASDTNVDKYAQTFNFAAWLLDAAETKNLDNLEDLIIVVESKKKFEDGDGTFKAYGVETGLYKTADAHMANDSDGTRLITLANRGGEESTVSSHVVYLTSYALTKAMLEALLVVQI